MGLEGGGEWKKKWAEMGGRLPTVNVAAGLALVDFCVEDSTGRFYDAVTSSTSFLEIAQAADTYLQRKKEQMPDCERFYGVLDVESLKPANKDVKRREATKGYQKFSEADVERFLAFCPFDAEDAEISEKIARIAPRLYDHDVEHKLANPGQDSYKYVINRMLRTHELRNLLFMRFVTGMRREMEGPTPPFRFVVLDGYPEIVERDGRRDVEHRVMTMKLNEEDGRLSTAIDTKPLVQRKSGEADIRVVKVADGLLRRGVAKTIYVGTRDTDLVPILLMGCRTRNGERDVLIDLGPGSRDGPIDVFSIYHLSSGMYSWMKEKFPESAGNQSNAIATLCTLMIMGGTDFVDKPPGAGFGRIWKFFVDIGHAFFRGLQLPDLRAGADQYRAWAVDLAKRLRAFTMALLATDSKVAGLPQRHVRYKAMVERRIECHGGPQKVQKRSAQSTRARLLNCIGKWDGVLEEARTRTRPQLGVIPQNLDWIGVYVSQTVWNVMYWNFMEVDCLMTEGNKPCWGWERGEDGRVIRAASAAPWSNRWQAPETS